MLWECKCSATHSQHWGRWPLNETVLVYKELFCQPNSLNSHQCNALSDSPSRLVKLSLFLRASFGTHVSGRAASCQALPHRSCWPAIQPACQPGEHLMHPAPSSSLLQWGNAYTEIMVVMTGNSTLLWRSASSWQRRAADPKGFVSQTSLAGRAGQAPRKASSSLAHTRTPSPRHPTYISCARSCPTHTQLRSHALLVSYTRSWTRTPSTL